MTLSQEYNNIKKKYYGLGGNFDVISSQFSIHYYFKSLETLDNFINNLSENINKGGYFIGTCYDGLNIFNLLKNQNSIEYTDSLNNLIYKIDKKYEIDDLTENNCLGIEIDVYMESIGQPITEYLVYFPYFIKKMKENGFILDKPNISKEYDIFNDTPNTYYKQLYILQLFYEGEGKNKEEVKGILDRRRNKGDPMGTPIPGKEFLELCIKLKDKYKKDPLQNMRSFGSFNQILNELDKSDNDIKYYKNMMNIYKDDKLLLLSSLNNYFIFKKI